MPNHTCPTEFVDRMNKMDRIPDRTKASFILLILFILSKIPELTFWINPLFPQKSWGFVVSFPAVGRL